MVHVNIVNWLKNDAPGRHKVYTAQEKNWDALGDEDLMKEAIKTNYIVLTQDKAFQSPNRYKICTHPGIIFLHQTLTTDKAIDMLKLFFLSGKRDACKHAIVKIKQGEAEIINVDGTSSIRL
jgi:predicted nuclease of predicted toxin-antitoxin system